MESIRIIRAFKNTIVPAGARPRRILAGPFKGIAMNLSLRSQMQMLTGLFEREIAPWLIRLSKGIRSAVDIGVAHGEYTLFILLRTEAKKVLAIEPDADMLRLFRANLQLNGLAGDSRLIIHEKLLGVQAGSNQISLDELAQQVEGPCLLKMDIDGGEAKVLAAASERLLRVPGLRWIIETHSPELEAECISILSEAGFFNRIVPNATWRAIIPEMRPSHNRWLVAVDRTFATLLQ